MLDNFAFLAESGMVAEGEFSLGVLLIPLVVVFFVWILISLIFKSLAKKLTNLILILLGFQGLVH
jgi:hypothetical protein